jgi:nitrogen regulatory protein P-II 1
VTIRVEVWSSVAHERQQGTQSKGFNTRRGDAMKLIKAIVSPNRLDDVYDALDRLQVSGMTVTEVRGHGRQKGHTAIYRGQEYEVTLLPKTQIEVVVTEAQVDSTIRAIVEAARTGEIGDGRLFVTPVEQAYRVRTGEREVA